MIVGQELWFVSSYNYARSIAPEERGEKTTVTKVGRKWVTLSNGHRVSREDNHVDGGNYASPGEVYASKQAYLDWLRLLKEWGDFRADVHRFLKGPNNVTVEKINQARELLQLPRPLRGN
jgi:hypothetical protein